MLWNVSTMVLNGNIKQINNHWQGQRDAESYNMQYQLWRNSIPAGPITYRCVIRIFVELNNICMFYKVAEKKVAQENQLHCVTEVLLSAIELEKKSWASPRFADEVCFNLNRIRSRSQVQMNWKSTSSC